MQELARFFKQPYTSMGVFYPKDYSLATFRSYSVAQEAAKALVADGLQQDCVRFIPPNEFLHFLDEIQSTATGMVMYAISRLTDTEGANALNDQKRAEQGAAFVAIHTPTEADALHVRDVIRPFEPMAMDYYVNGGVESLISSAEPAALLKS